MRDGFTLLEVMVSVSILAISFVAILSANNRALMMSAESVSLSKAVTLAREELERAQIEKLKLSVGVSEKKTSKEYPGLAWRFRVATTPFGAVKKADITIFSADDKKETGIVTLSSYITK
jgi:prepilin-type N-terminal cleavage/methylation domain-containing protein